jgi:hypothetical protein
MPDTSTHPSPQALALFGYGKLSEAQTAAVAAHLETCPDCRKAVASLPPDSFLGKIHAVRPGVTSVAAVPSLTRKEASPSRMGKSATPVSPPANVPPELVNHPKFHIVRELGRGGMGVIYLAEHRVLEKLVALKVVSPAVLDNPDALARFHAEARAAAKLDHPNIAAPRARTPGHSRAVSLCSDGQTPTRRAVPGSIPVRFSRTENRSPGKIS